MLTPVPPVSLRPWTEDDGPAMDAWFQHAEVPKYLAPRTTGINLRRGAVEPGWVLWDEHSVLYGVLQGTSSQAPLIGIGALHSPGGGAIELGLIIGEPTIWGRGYGRAATLALAKKAFADPACSRVVTRIQPDNSRALACYRAVGFETRQGHAREPVWLFLTRTAWALQHGGLPGHSEASAR